MYVGGELVVARDYAGPAGTRRVLRDARVEGAVLETARGGLLRRGLAVDRADVAVVTNLSNDHFGEYGIDDLEQGSTYSAPQFTNQFGSFSSLLQRYGGPAALKVDLDAVKEHLYIPMAA